MTNFPLPSISRGIAATLGLLNRAARAGAVFDNSRGRRRLRRRFDAHFAAMGAGHAEGRRRRRRLHDHHQQGFDAGSRVNCVSDDASKQCQIHSMTMEGGVMKMRPVEGGLEIKPGETVDAEAGRLSHDVRRPEPPAEQGKSVEAELKFDHAGTVKVDYPIAAFGAPAPGAAAGGGTMMMQGPSGAMSGPSGGMQMGK